MHFMKNKIIIIGSSCEAAKILISNLIKKYEVVGISRKGNKIKSRNYQDIKKNFLNITPYEIKGCRLLINFAFNRKDNKVNYEISKKITELKSELLFKTVFISTILAKNLIYSKYAEMKESQHRYYDRVLYLSTIVSKPAITAEKEIINFFLKLKPLKFIFFYGKIEFKLISEKSYIKQMNNLIEDRFLGDTLDFKKIDINQYLSSIYNRNIFYIPVFVPIKLIKNIIVKLRLFKKGGVNQKLTNLFFS